MSPSLNFQEFGFTKMFQVKFGRSTINEVKFLLLLCSSITTLSTA